MRLDTRRPGLQVTLVKNVSRTTLDGATPVSSRFTGANPVIDLTPYMGEHNGVRVSKSVREAAGSFSITLTDQLYYQGNTSYGDSLYGLIEPMDSIEIRMTGNAYKQSANGACSRMPMMMRGFVSVVKKVETMGADGRPQRQILVSGQDYGKILQIMQVFYMPGSPDDANYLTSFPFFTKFGIGATMQNTGDFYRQVFDKVVNPYIASMRKNPDGSTSQAPLLPIATDFIAQAGQVSPFGTGDFRGGTIYSLIQSCGDIGPWNEFFIEDREDAPYAVYRPNPFYGVDQLPIFSFPSGKFPVTNKITRQDVVSDEASRTDANVANYFWCDAPRFNLNYVEAVRAMAVQASQDGIKPFVTDYPNIDPALYGARKLWEQTQQGGPLESNNGNGTPDGAARFANQGDAVDWMTQRRLDLFNQNKDNVILESGSLRLKGNEAIKAGTYVQYGNGDMQSMYYAVAVEHDFAPYGSYFTTVQFERGTNFINRIQRNAGRDSPYLAELADRS
jgi:hypothetical protein